MTSGIQTNQELSREIAGTFQQLPFKSFQDERAEAIHHFEQLGFPGNKNEEYRFTPITKGIEKFLLTADLSGATRSSISSIAPYLLPGLDVNCLTFVNGRFEETLSNVISPRREFQVLSLEQVLVEKPEWVMNHFAKLVDFKIDGFAAFNTAFWRDAVFVRVAANTVVDKPVLILQLHDTTVQPVVSASRLLLVIEENSEVQLIEKFDSQGTQPVFNSWVEEIAVKEKATLHYCKIQNDPGAFYQVASTVIHQAQSSHVNTYTITLNGKMVRNNFRIAIDGEHCESHFHGLYLLNNDTLADNHTVVDHQKPNSFSNELYKGVMDGNAKGIFNGKIYVRPQAQKTNAFQSNRNVLLTDTSVVHTKPQLEIWADDVKCSHGCTSGQLDEEALFYLQSRGISRANAQAMLLYAFASETLDDMKDPVLRSYLDSIISVRLQKNF